MIDDPVKRIRRREALGEITPEQAEDLIAEWGDYQRDCDIDREADEPENPTQPSA